MQPTRQYAHQPHPHPPSTCMAIPNWLLSKLVMQRASVRRKRRNVFIDESDELINRYPLHCREMDRRLTHPCWHTHTHTHTSWWKALLLILSFALLIFNCSTPSPRGTYKKKSDILSLWMSTNLLYYFYKCTEKNLLLLLSNTSSGKKKSVF